MTNLTHVQTALTELLPAQTATIRQQRGNELYLTIDRNDILPLAKHLRDSFGAELALMVADDRRPAQNGFEVFYLFANPVESWFVQTQVNVPAHNPTIPSLATFYLPASRYEREIRDMFGIEPAGHPDPRPLVRHAFWPADYYPLRKDAVSPEYFEDDGSQFPFKQVEGEGVYEIPVGPVHAGIIEPGHFRFSVVGETVINLKIRLYFTHKGTEKLFEGRSPAEGVKLAERISGDTTIGHALAYCQALERLAGTPIPDRARYLRVVLLEMERLYNHMADFGAIANDTGFAAAHAHCYRLREQLLRLNKQLTGNRLLRNGVTPGGVSDTVTIPPHLAAELDRLLADFNEIVAISLQNTMLTDRLIGSGRLTAATVQDHGAQGYIARASGLNLDARRDHPFAAYDALQFNVPVFDSGDVYARTMVRVQEARESVNLIKQALEALPEHGPLATPLGQLPPFEPVFSVVEGWRGAIIHWLMADESGWLYRVKVKDPSFVNWPALSFALLNNIVPDFPLCNKSFNQSYSGNDL